MKNPFCQFGFHKFGPMKPVFNGVTRHYTNLRRINCIRCNYVITYPEIPPMPLLVGEIESQIIAYVFSLPEGQLILVGAMSYLGSTETISEILSKLVHIGKLNEVYEGVYVRPVETRFGTRLPDIGMVIPQLAEFWKETIVPSGGSAANLLGMTTQVPMVPVYLTSGVNRTLYLGEVAIELRHAEDWQLLEPNQPVGNAIRALGWMGPEQIEQSIKFLGPMLSVEEMKELKELASSCITMPKWITSSLTAMKVIS